MSDDILIELKEKYVFEIDFFNSKDKEKIKAIEKQLTTQAVDYIYKFYVHHHIDKNPYSTILSPLRYNEFKLNISSEWDYRFISEISYKELCNLLDFCELIGVDKLGELAAVKLADYYKKVSFPEIQSNFLLSDSQLTEEDLLNIIENEKDLSEFIEGLNKNDNQV